MAAIIHIALGGNRWHGIYGAPERVVAAAIEAITASGMRVVARSSIRATKPLGPSKRRFANAVVAIESDLPLPEIFRLLQGIEHGFGRRRGRRWAARVLDLDIIAAGSTVVGERRGGLIIPHRALAERGFVLDPLAEIAPGWRHPLLHLTARQLRARLRRPRSQAAGPLAQSVEQAAFNR